MDFEMFKTNVAVAYLVAGLELQDELKQSTSYGGFKRRVQVRNTDEENWSEFQRVVKKIAGTCSSGESVFLAAFLYLLGYFELADAHDKGRTWSRMHSVSGPHQAAVAACITQGNSDW